MVIRQGDVVWLGLPAARGSAPVGRRPAVVLQQIATVDRSDLRSIAGHLSRGRLSEVWSGVRLVLEPRAAEA
jgi:mRNA-degrading endonuclease toxin of MazEF toxin-antitoxin module